MKPLKSIIILFFFVSVPVYSQLLNPGDGVRITFYNITEKISGDYFIQQDGNLQLPYLGLIAAQNQDFKDVKKDILKGYDSLYKNPEITIQPLLKINILGEVRQPGFYYVTGVEKLSGLMALAGGETSDADIEGMYIIRDDREIELSSEELIADGNTVADIGLQSGDRIFVPREWWVGARNAAVIVSGVAVLVTIVSLFVRR